MKKLIFGMLLIIMSSAWSQKASITLQDKLNAMRTMSASFNQIVKAQNREISRSKGIMALERPGKFRWHTQSPMEQIIVADGNKLWIYDAELEQVTVKAQDKGIGGTAALFLSGYNNNVAQDFDVKLLDKGNKTIFDLSSKSEKANFQRVKLVFKGDVLVSIEFYDQLGQHTEVELNNVKTNLKLTSNLFKFKVPSNVDLVEQ